MKKKLKQNVLFGCIYLKITDFLFKIIQVITRVKKNQILFVSFSGKKYSDSPKEIFEELKKDPDFSNYEFKWAFVDPSNFTEIDENDKININSMQYLFWLAKSKYWISNASIERLVPFNANEHIYINTWHGIPMKTLGIADAKSDYLVKHWYEKANIDFLTVSGTYDESIMKSVFPNAKNFLEAGLPRNKKLYLAQSNSKFASDTREKTSRILGIDENKKNILYAPTFRNSESEMQEVIEEFKKIEQTDLFENYNILFRGHYFSRSKINAPFIDVSDYGDINDLFILSDILITDYSSVIFDYSILRRLAILFIPDLENYTYERGFYVYPQDLGLPIEKNYLDVYNQITKEKESMKTKKIYQKYHNFRFDSIEQIKKIIRN